jgi:hypothetical protein
VPVGLVEEVGQKGRKHLMTSMIYGRYSIPKGVTVNDHAGGKSSVNKKEKSQWRPMLECNVLSGSHSVHVIF